MVDHFESEEEFGGRVMAWIEKAVRAYRAMDWEDRKQLWQYLNERHDPVSTMLSQHGFEHVIGPRPRIARRERSYKKAKITARVRRQVMERDSYRCRSCETHLDLTLDHIVPESLGGVSTEDNLQTLCRPCNSRKGAR